MECLVRFLVWSTNSFAESPVNGSRQMAVRPMSLCCWTVADCSFNPTLMAAFKTVVMVSVKAPPRCRLLRRLLTCHTIFFFLDWSRCFYSLSSFFSYRLPLQLRLEPREVRVHCAACLFVVGVVRLLVIVLVVLA